MGKIAVWFDGELIQKESDWIASVAEPPVTENDYRLAIQRLIDAKAQSRRYDSGNSLATYVTSSNPDWAAEAQAFVIWRDAVWAYAYAELDKVLAGEREQPSVEAFLAELPQLVWPA